MEWSSGVVEKQQIWEGALSGLVGQFSGLVGKWSGLVGKWSGLVG